MKPIRTLQVFFIYLPLQILTAQETEEIPMIVSDRYVYDKDFFDELIIKKEIILYDDAGVRASVKTKDVWGYVLHGRLHIMVGARFQRIILTHWGNC